ncbi:MAG: alpha/beta fold hydrolase [Synechococcus sp.]
MSQAPLTLVLAHGAGAGMDSPFMEFMAVGLANHGWRVVRFEFPYMVKRRLTGRQSPPDRAERLVSHWSDQLEAFCDAGPVVVGGKSMGGRIASVMADQWLDQQQIVGCICLGYPFHPLGKPQQLRVAHLEQMRTPTLILQGERDPMGRRDLVEGLKLSPSIEVEWVPDGDHSYKPRRSSGRTEVMNLEMAVESVHGCLQRLWQS